jgi:hypothetical protein
MNAWSLTSNPSYPHGLWYLSTGITLQLYLTQLNESVHEKWLRLKNITLCSSIIMNNFD